MLLALVLAPAVTCPGGASAHSLPGSVLTFWQDGAELNLAVEFPLDELIVADPEFADLEPLAAGSALSAAQERRLAAYFTDHLVLRQDAGDLPQRLVGTTLEMAENDHVGRFRVLTVAMTAPLADGEVFPLTLTYDAVMHQVRSHRATVYSGQPGATLRGMADFGHRRIGGKQQPVLLQKPQGKAAKPDVRPWR